MLHVLSPVGLTGSNQAVFRAGSMLCVNPNMIRCLGMQESHGAGGLWT